VRPYVVSHLNAKLQNWQWAGIYFFQGKSRNVHRIAGLLIKCNSFAESPNLVQETGLYSPSLLISCSVTIGIRCESARGPVAFSPRENAPSDQLAPDGRLPGMAAPTLDTQREER